jgi:hypothetical protein
MRLAPDRSAKIKELESSSSKAIFIIVIVKHKFKGSDRADCALLGRSRLNFERTALCDGAYAVGVQRPFSNLSGITVVSRAGLTRVSIFSIEIIHGGMHEKGGGDTPIGRNQHNHQTP